MRIILLSIGVGIFTSHDAGVPKHSRESLDLLHTHERIRMTWGYEIMVRPRRMDGMIHGST